MPIFSMQTANEWWQLNGGYVLKRECVQCRAELPAKTSFCVACGCSSETNIASRKVALEKKFKQRAGLFKLFDRFATAFWFWGRS